MRKSHIKNIIWLFLMLIGMLLSGYSWATTVSELPPIFVDSRYGIGFGIALFFIGTLIFVYRLFGNFLWHEPDVILSSYEKNISTDESFYKSAILEVHNDEEIPITRCFATLEVADDVHINNANVPSTIPLIPSVKKSQRIRWEEEHEMNENCEITIMGGASRHISVASFTNMFRYLLQGGDIETHWEMGTPVHTLKIRIDGYFNERQMKPLFFEGYIYAANLTPPDDFIARKGKFKSKAEETNDRIRNLRMIFKSGEWKNDNEIKKYMDVKEYSLV